MTYKNTDVIKETTYKGTRILFKGKAEQKRNILNRCINIVKEKGYEEIIIPIIQQSETFKSKIGNENLNLMFNFRDKSNRELCLAPEYTSIIQKLSKKTFKFQKDIKLFYVGECFRGEQPQKARYRQFTQFGVEIINPTKDYTKELQTIATNIIKKYTTKFRLSLNVKRGLDYYKDGKGFEINVNSLGKQKQICGGGEYDGGIGFAIGIDRLIDIEEMKGGKKDGNKK